MANRRNFLRPVRVEIVKRATRYDGQQACEQCGAVGCRLEIHHVEMDAMVLDENKKSRKLTAADGKLLCEPCHDVESKKQAPVLAKVLRVEARHLGVRTRSARKLKGPDFQQSEQQAARKAKREANPKIVPPRRGGIARQYGIEG